jgi:predicted membrane channel-forming protein YqfA (hemolysin III family)
MKKINMHPRLAGGINALAILSVSLIVEMATGLPLIREKIIYVGIFAIITGTIIYHIFDSKYNPEENDNIMMFVFGIILVILFAVLAYVNGQINR